ncbi:amidohydrolase family protein [Rhodococcus maanshanensis]|uniref:amidohydrolase family protein n=1 Tax=Rhodococcus maanshanensis TaxID=183556 RepID=UPI0022B5BCE7|nr:amidohydrolase family protein [Rhodococcus maanshanensis]MCZ4554532.1 amidohydrolase family protein [Rhodococcus maanshanensis]
MADNQAIAIVDPHVHHWLPSRRPWYPLMQQRGDARPSTLVDLRRLAHDYTAADYLVDTAGYEVRAIVHVSAVSRTGTHLDELEWIGELARADGWPAAAIGTVDPAAGWPSIRADLDTQRRNPLFRGIRVLRGLRPDSEVTVPLLDYLRRHSLVFDLVAHPRSMPGWSEVLRGHENLAVVLEHAGWPIAAADFDEWSAALGVLGERANVQCKISGLGMALHTLDGAAQRPWVLRCLEVFGPRRAMFASNFPVDRMYGEFDRLYDGYRAAAAQFDADARSALFETNARRVYGLLPR